MARIIKSNKQSSSNQEKFNEAVRKIAFELYEKRGCTPGNDLSDWLEAEKIARKRQSW